MTKMNLRSDFDAEYNVDYEEILFDMLRDELSRWKSDRLREKIVRKMCEDYGLEEDQIEEMVDWFV
tara:strand:- start:2216 stop:2413 length:198 start_codon:yes stop_codon:yes gene_type:complete